jgi:hypothetical protein
LLAIVFIVNRLKIEKHKFIHKKKKKKKKEEEEEKEKKWKWSVSSLSFEAVDSSNTSFNYLMKREKITNANGLPPALHIRVVTHQTL